MTPLLRDNPDNLNALVRQTAAALGIPVVYVEKDFWVTEVLRAASPVREISLPGGTTAKVSFILKGGTSLSRAFGIIDRFSEDVDLLAVFPEDATRNARHAVLKRVDADVTAHLRLTAADVAVASSTTGVKRYTTYAYPTESSGDGVKEGILLELGSRGGTHPASEHTYRSMVAEYALTIGDGEDTWEEFASFEVYVLAPERTLLEKVAAVHDAATRIDTESLLKHGRHFYDIYQLLNDSRVVQALQALGPDGIAALVEDINDHSEAAEFTWSTRPEGGYADSPAFDPNHQSGDTIAIGYQSAQGLIHGTPVTIEKIMAAVAEHRELL